MRSEAVGYAAGPHAGIAAGEDIIHHINYPPIGGSYMQVKLNVIVAAAVALCAGSVYAEDIVVRIGHVGPVSGSQAHYGKDNENGARMAVEDLNKAYRKF